MPVPAKHPEQVSFPVGHFSWSSGGNIIPLGDASMNSHSLGSQSTYSVLSPELEPCTQCALRMHLLFSDSGLGAKDALLLPPEIEMQNKPREGALHAADGLMVCQLLPVKTGLHILRKN